MNVIGIRLHELTLYQVTGGVLDVPPSPPVKQKNYPAELQAERKMIL
jgi:hypothetical protein